MLQEHDWQSGCFKVLSVRQAWQSNERVATILEKDGLRFTVVNPRFYLPESGLRLYDKADEEALSAWMDTVQVGRSYEFELMRPAYPADSIADFLPLRTIPGSIYAADGEAYGYFFARLHGPKMNNSISMRKFWGGKIWRCGNKIVPLRSLSNTKPI